MLSRTQSLILTGSLLSEAASAWMAGVIWTSSFGASSSGSVAATTLSGCSHELA
jgi:hypothetical protein